MKVPHFIASAAEGVTAPPAPPAAPAARHRAAATCEDRHGLRRGAPAPPRQGARAGCYRRSHQPTGH